MFLFGSYTHHSRKKQHDHVKFSILTPSANNISLEDHVSHIQDRRFQHQQVEETDIGTTVPIT